MSNKVRDFSEDIPVVKPLFGQDNSNTTACLGPTHVSLNDFLTMEIIQNMKGGIL